MDEVDKEQEPSESFLKVADDKKRRWSFRKGKKQIKKLWKSKRSSKQVDGDQSSQGDSGDSESIVRGGNEKHPMSPTSTTSSIDPLPSITLHRPSITAEEVNNSSPEYTATSTDDDEAFTTGSRNPTGLSRGAERGALVLTNVLMNGQESNVC